MMRRLRNPLAAATAAGVALAAGVVAGPAAAVGSVGCTKKIPRIDATISTTGLSFGDDEALTAPAGPLRIRLHAKGGDGEIALQRFKGDYDGKDLAADIAATFAGGSFHQAPMRRAEKHTVALGGVDVKAGKWGTMTVDLKPGTYYVNNDTGDVPTEFHKLKIVDRGCHHVMKSTSATITMKGDHRFGGDTTLPAEGSILVRNVSKDFDELHFATLLRVKPGTTRKQVIDGFQAAGPPTFALKDKVGTDALAPGRQQVLTYDLPKGTYALVCFFPDLMDGKPHAFTGMVKIVRLK
jgi:uncharacterized cupredoxin-like copper-binding protein